MLVPATAFVMVHPKHEVLLRLSRRDRDHNGGRTDREFEEELESAPRMKSAYEVVVSAWNLSSLKHPQLSVRVRYTSPPRQL